MYLGTTYKTDFLNRGSTICPVKLKLATPYRGTHS